MMCGEKPSNIHKENLNFTKSTFFLIIPLLFGPAHCGNDRLHRGESSITIIPYHNNVGIIIIGVNFFSSVYW